jgi:hypothetical protein
MVREDLVRPAQCLLLVLLRPAAGCCLTAGWGMQTAGTLLSWRQRLLLEFRIERKVTDHGLHKPLIQRSVRHALRGRIRGCRVCCTCSAMSHCILRTIQHAVSALGSLCCAA